MKKTMLVSVVSFLVLGAASVAVGQEAPGYTDADVLEQQLDSQDVQTVTADFTSGDQVTAGQVVEHLPAVQAPNREIVCAAHPEGKQRIFYAVGYYPHRVQIRAVGRCELDSSQRCRALGCVVKK